MEWTTGKATPVFLIFYLTTCSYVNGSHEMSKNIVNLLNDLVDSEAEPTNVFIKSCWSLSVNTDILRNATMQIVFIDDFMFKLPIELSPNHVMFLTSLDCDWTEDFLNGVRNAQLN